MVDIDLIRLYYQPAAQSPTHGYLFNHIFFLNFNEQIDDTQCLVFCLGTLCLDLLKVKRIL